MRRDQTVLSKPKRPRSVTARQKEKWREPPLAKRARWALAVALALVSAGTLAFELTLTRLFSVIFRYHYVFLAVSLAILGLGLGAASGNRLARRRGRVKVWRDLIRLAMILVASFPVVALFLSLLTSATSVWPAAVLALIPFFVTGLFNAFIYAHFASQSGLLYGADLIGAAIGSLLAIALLAWGGAFTATLSLGALGALAALTLALSLRSWRAARVGGGILALILVAAIGNRIWGWIDLSPSRLRNPPPDKTMLLTLQDPAQGARLVDTAWGPFARIDVVETNDPTEKQVFTDGGAGSYMLRFSGDLGEVSSLANELTFLPFVVGPTERVLVLGAGAGKDVLLARLAGARAITAVEINPTIVAVTRRWGDYNGHILDLPGVETVVTDGRNFVERTQSRYDLIYLNVVYTQAAEPGSAALAENYIFTDGAFRAYWRALSDDGRVAVITHNTVEGIRALITAVQGLEKEGLSTPEAMEHVSLLMLPAENPYERTAILLLRRQPWADDVAALQKIASVYGLYPLYLPGVAERPFAKMVQGRTRAADFFSGGEYNWFPATDDRPFFYHLDPGVPAPLLILTTIVAVLLLVYFLWLLAAGRRTVRTHVGFGLYFIALGTGYMLIEVPLIQRFILLLGNPTLSLATVLGGLLLGNGLGSLFSQRLRGERLSRLAGWMALGIALTALLYTFGVPLLVYALLPTALGVRLGVTLLLLLPLGFLLGIPFPCGLRLSSDALEHSTAGYWGLNAVASVLGSALATVLALQAGFRWVSVLGAASYLIAAVVALSYPLWQVTAQATSVSD